MFKIFLVKRLSGSADKQIPVSFPAFEASVCELPPSKQYQGTLSPFPEPDFPRSLYGTRSPSNRGHIRDATVGASFTNIPMTSPFTLEINRTVAALAAETEFSPTVAEKSGVGLQPQSELRPQLPFARPVCLTSIQRADDACERGGVIVPRQVTRTKSRHMVGLEVFNGRARVVVDEALYNDWKKGNCIKDVKRR